MGKILNFYVSDDLGNPLNQKGKGKINSINENYSGNKISERLVLNVSVRFDDKTIQRFVLKLAPMKGKLDSTEKLSVPFKNNNRYINSSVKKFNEICLKNAYLHEAEIYNFFNNNISDPIINNNVLKSFGCGFSENGIIILKKEEKEEEFNIFEHTGIRQMYIKNFMNKNHKDRIENILYLTTEYNANYQTLRKGFDAIDPLNLRINALNFINTTLETLIHCNNSYKFCHWDFHSENILYDKENGNIKLFDFDFSSLDDSSGIPKSNVNPLLSNSRYIQYVAYFYGIIFFILKSKKFGNPANLSSSELIQAYNLIKNKIAHYFDIYQFLSNCDRDTNIDLTDMLSEANLNYKKIINIYLKTKEIVQDIDNLLLEYGIEQETVVDTPTGDTIVVDVYPETEELLQKIRSDYRLSSTYINKDILKIWYKTLKQYTSIFSSPDDLIYRISGIFGAYLLYYFDELPPSLSFEYGLLPDDERIMINRILYDEIEEEQEEEEEDTYSLLGNITSGVSGVLSGISGGITNIFTSNISENEAVDEDTSVMMSAREVEDTQQNELTPKELQQIYRTASESILKMKKPELQRLIKTKGMVDPRRPEKGWKLLKETGDSRYSKGLNTNVELLRELALKNARDPEVNL